jgi:hypothetical protein
MINVTWQMVKNLCTSKSLKMQYVEDDFFYMIFAVDGTLILSTIIDKTITSTEKTEFETTYKPTANQKLGLDQEPFALPSFRTKLNCTPSIIDVAPDTTTAIDYQITEERYATGGTLIVHNAQLGDYVTASVYDKDGVIPAPYRPALCEAHPIVATYVEKHWVEAVSDKVLMSINTYPLNAKISIGLYLRLTYHAVGGSLDRKVAVNYKLSKKL